ncbi:alpha/beta fold hydrolase [Pseudonocardia parietis]|uniref:Pimeloyl-ACP methyl ester carboxylesterase n=1 Tax=Pseudonocardia parietis TaxID=570936 RepID=A0ABS4VXS1_9PSEU|nr:alpha/beta fold hydrolase [Pseudonocardia parietis]MBP2368721.1 pimeloyl-ACP methyl ester carboxylesterase [Pseudonocardia parietis]
MDVSGTVRSSDGTVLAYERVGSGPALVLVDPALGYRDFDNVRGLGKWLADEFTVFTYDRRGRGGSSDTLPYTVQREVDDLAAVIAQAGGNACVYGFSSGALLALQAGAVGSGIEKLVLMEPPIGADDDPDDAAFTAEIAELVATDRRREAVERFLGDLGPEVLAGLQESMPVLEAVAPTLVYDCLISHATTTALLATVATPTLVLDSQGSSDDLTGWAADIAAALPNARHRSLPGGWHGVPVETLGPVVAEFCRAG